MPLELKKTLEETIIGLNNKTTFDEQISLLPRCYLISRKNQLTDDLTELKFPLTLSLRYKVKLFTAICIISKHRMFSHTTHHVKRNTDLLYD